MKWFAAVLVAFASIQALTGTITRVDLHRPYISTNDIPLPGGAYFIGPNGNYGNDGSFNNPLLYAFADTNIWASGTLFYWIPGLHTNLTGTTNLTIVGGHADGSTNNILWSTVP